MVCLSARMKHPAAHVARYWWERSLVTFGHSPYSFLPRLRAAAGPSHCRFSHTGAGESQSLLRNEAVEWVNVYANEVATEP